MALRELLPDRLTALDAFVVERVLNDGGEGNGSINGALRLLCASYTYWLRARANA
jgi:hypothetical protein